MPARRRQGAFYDDAGLWIDLPAAAGVIDAANGFAHLGATQRHVASSSEGTQTLQEVLCHVMLGTSAALLFIALPLALWNYAKARRKRPIEL